MKLAPTRPVSLARPTRLTAAVLVPATILFAACQISVSPRKPQTNPQDHASEDIAMTTQQVRLLMRSLVDPMSGEIESAADEIIAKASQAGVKRAALEWKAQAIPAIRESLFQPDPITALFDTWVFTNQMAIYFSSGPGRNSFGSQGSTAVATCLRLERQMNDVATSITKSGDVSKGRVLAREWAAAHPITTAIAHRESTLTRAADREIGPLSPGQAVADLSMTIDDLNRRIEIYTDQVVRQARWEAELLTMDLSDQLELDQAIPLAAQAVGSADRITDSMDSISGSVAHAVDSVDGVVGSVEELVPAIERLVKVVEASPALIARERSSAILAVKEELGRTIELVQEERQVALQYVTNERLAALQSLHELIAQERETLTGDVETISIKAIDHAFWRMSQLLAAALLVVLGAALIGLGLIRRMISGLREEWTNAQPAGSGSAP